MPVPHASPPLDQLGPRPFSFYPPIRNVEHNEWLFRRATWSEILVLNTKSSEEIWVPRRFLGEVSSVDEPVMIVGLVKELEYKSGAVWPHERRVIEMPRMAGQALPPTDSEPEPKQPAPVVGIRYEPSPELRIGRLIAAALILGVLACFIVVSVFRKGSSGERITFSGVLQSDLPFTAEDDYHAIVRRLGPPADDQWRTRPGEMQYRRLNYPSQSVTVILMGTERDHARYIGAVDKDWRPVHSVRLPSGADSAPMLRGIKPF